MTRFAKTLKNSLPSPLAGEGVSARASLSAEARSAKAEALGETRLPGRSSRRKARLRPTGFGVAALLAPRAKAGEGWMAFDDQRGFTLVELMVVIVIIGLLATVVMVNVLPSQDRAMVEKARADIAVLEQAVETYRIETLAFPRTEDGLQALIRAPASLARPERYRPGGYIRRLPDDPWGNAYRYAYPGRRGAYDIYSLGADGREGGEGNEADIGNW
jgi:general secretion pathway protein G